MFVVTILGGMVVGLSLGLTGGGGSILAVPLLVFGLGIASPSAVSISLASVGAMSLVGASHRLLRGLVELKTGILFAVAGMVGAPLGTWIGGLLPEALLLLLFAGLMLGVAVQMWRKATRSPEEVVAIAEASTRPGSSTERGPACRRSPTGELPLRSRCVMVLCLAGVLTGVLSGLFGVGGGFVLVPALILITSLDYYRAVATSLFVMAIVSGAALISHLVAGRLVPMEIAIPFTIGGVVGLGVGTWGGRRISPVLLQKIFAILILSVALYVLAQGAMGAN